MKKTISTKQMQSAFINRELSWLDFNLRVLEVAEEMTIPLLERLKFLAITASNLDEFLQVRIGSLYFLVANGLAEKKEDSGLTNSEQLVFLRAKILDFMCRQYKVFSQIERELKESSIFVRDVMKMLTKSEIHFVDQYVKETLTTVITPMPLTKNQIPVLKNLGLYLLVHIEHSEKPYWIIPLHATSRFLSLPTRKGMHILIEELVVHYIKEWFMSEKVISCNTFRVTRNADFAVRENELPNLVQGMEEVLLKRQLAEVVRLEINEDIDSIERDVLLKMFCQSTEETARLFPVNGPLDLSCFFYIASLPQFDMLQFQPWNILPTNEMPANESIFTQIAKKDRLIIHPYETFDTVVRFIEEAANDPHVLAIKQILYRSGKTSKIIDALILAAERGKSVTVIVELKARFDEERNIDWALKLERYGVQVIYGVANYKTHAKICMVVRKEPTRIMKYMHFATGNYNAVTAKIYSDIGFFTANPMYAEDATLFFNTICGITSPRRMNVLAMSPLTLRDQLLNIIDRAILYAKSSVKTQLTVKVNSLCDRKMIEKLYEASCAGVKIRLNIRGVCTLKPGVKKLSENIIVRSVVDRYLEHARIIHLQCTKEELVYISSADWMPRNLDRRIELLIPIESLECRKKILHFLEFFFKDNQHAWDLNSEGVWTRSSPVDVPAFSAQLESQHFLEKNIAEHKKEAIVSFKPYKRKK